MTLEQLTAIIGQAESAWLDAGRLAFASSQPHGRAADLLRAADEIGRGVALLKAVAWDMSRQGGSNGKD